MNAKSVVALLVAVAWVLGVSGCSNSGSTRPTPEVPAPASSVTSTAVAIATATASATPRVAQPIAPEGRPADPVLATLVERLLHDDAAMLERRFANVGARDVRSGPPTGQKRPAGEWAPELAGRARSLYAVRPSTPGAEPDHDADVVLAVGAGEPEAWRFAVANGAVVGLTILRNTDGSVGGPFGAFLVLPPARDLPQAPAGYRLAAGVPRTNVAGVDALLDALTARDAVRLAAAVRFEKGVVPAQQCNLAESLTPAALAVRFERITTEAFAVSAVIDLPEGYPPPADHLIVIVLEPEPYRWTEFAIVEAGGSIVGLQDGCVAYPVHAFLVPPPEARAIVDPAAEPRSNVATINAAVDALIAHDWEAFVASIDFTLIGCVTRQTDIGAPPLCQAGEAEGTIVQALRVAGCEGGYARRDEIHGLVDYLAGPEWELYAVADRGRAASGYWVDSSRFAAILTPVDKSQRIGAVGLFFNDAGLVAISTGCGAEPPEMQLARVGRGADMQYLLPPPGR